VKLSDEQREWLNAVFIPNFRAELIRTLKPEDLMSSKERAKQRSFGPKGPADAGEEHAASPTPPGPDETEEANPSGEAGTALDTAAEEADEKSAQRVVELEADNRRLRAALAETRIEQELVWAAAAQHAVNPAQVAQLLKDRVRLDANLDPTVVDANGDRTHDGYGNPITVADAVKAFLDENPHMVQPSSELTGGGSGGTDATALTARTAALTGGELIAEALKAGA